MQFDVYFYCARKFQLRRVLCARLRTSPNAGTAQNWPASSRPALDLRRDPAREDIPPSALVSGAVDLGTATTAPKYHF